MNTKVTTETFNEMQKIFIKVTDENLSYQELEAALLPYNRLPLLCKYFHSKYYYRHGDHNKASKLISDVILGLDQNGTESEIILLCFSYALKEIYGIAGEIYAHNNEYDKSLRAYQDYHICVLRLKSAEAGSFLLFRRYNEYSLSDLIHNEVTVISPSRMNDPYDTLLFKWTESLTHGETQRPHLKPYCDALNSYRIRSFTKVTNSKGQEMIGNTLMWSHYTEDHKGFCIKYSFSEQFTSNTEERRTIRFKDIIYHDETKPLNIIKESIDTDIGLCTKQAAWSYENEVRMIAFEPEAKEFFNSVPLDPASKIDAIYFGYRCQENHIRTIRKIVTQHYPDAKFYKMTSDYTDIYNLSAEEI